MGKVTVPSRRLPLGTDVRRGGLRRLGQLPDSDLERRIQVVKATRSPLDRPHLVAQPLDSRHLGDLHGHGLLRLGHAERLGHASIAARTRPVAPRVRGHRDPEFGQGHSRPRPCRSGTTYVEAIYAASGNYLAQTSNVVAQVVPSACPPSAHRAATEPIVGARVPGHLRNEWERLLVRLRRELLDQRLRWERLYRRRRWEQRDLRGDGNDGVVAGNGENAVILGNGNDKVSLGNGSDGVEAGNGNDTRDDGQRIGGVGICVGNGTDTVTVGTGSNNRVELGHGTDTVTVQRLPRRDRRLATATRPSSSGRGPTTTYIGQPHRTNVCHLPKPPSSCTERRRPTTTTRSLTARW